MIKRNQRDNAWPLSAVLKDGAGLAVNLTGRTVTISIVDYYTGQIMVKDGACVVASAVGGSVTYDLSTLSTWPFPVGDYKVLWTVTEPRGVTFTIPTSEPEILRVMPMLC